MQNLIGYSRSFYCLKNFYCELDDFHQKPLENLIEIAFNIFNDVGGRDVHVLMQMPQETRKGRSNIEAYLIIIFILKYNDLIPSLPFPPSNSSHAPPSLLPLKLYLLEMELQVVLTCLEWVLRMEHGSYERATCFVKQLVVAPAIFHKNCIKSSVPNI